jgi:hypothetical protein
MTINNSLLKEKYNNVIKSIRDMMSAMTCMRPTCEQLLNNKSQWALSVSDIQNDSMLKKFKNLSISESFFTRFIKLKLKNLKEDFGNPEISSKTLIEPKILPETPVEPKMNDRT